MSERDTASSLLFIFDMDDVLYDYDWQARRDALMAHTGLTGDELFARWWGARHEDRAETGDPDSGEGYLEVFNAAVGGSLTADEWIAIRRSAMTPRPDALAAVARAAELGRVTLLTNNGALVHEHLGSGLAPELAGLFGEHLFTSAHYGARKPDPEVFRRVLARYGTDPADAFFTDDLPENVEGARSIGITAHLYDGAPGLLAAIEEFAASRTGR